MTLLKQYISNRTGEFTLFGLIVLSFSIMSILMPDRFLTTDNIGNMMFQSAELGILSLAMAISLIIGGIDLSVVAMANLTAIILCYVLKWLTPASMVMPASLMIILFTGLLWGGINGLLVTKIKLPPILATLGTMTLYAGIGIGLTNGSTITGIPDMLQHIGSGTFFYLPIPIYFTIFCFIVVGWIMNHTPL